MRVWLAAALGAIALAGCGGNDTAAGESAIGLAPADALGYAELDSSLDSDQWTKVQALLDRFPSRPQLVAELDRQLAREQLQWERDVAPALGDSVALIWIGNTADDVVWATQPEDEAKLRALVEKLADKADTDYVLGELDGWTLVAERTAVIDALKSGDGELADNDAYQAALDELPDERLAFGWLRKEALSGADLPNLEFEWLAGAIEARDDGAAVTLVERLTGDAGDSYTSRRIEEAPADALAFLSFDTQSLRANTSSLAPLANLFGIRVDQLLADIEGEGALWVLPAAGFPEVTLVLNTASPERHVPHRVSRAVAGWERALDRRARRGARGRGRRRAHDRRGHGRDAAQATGGRAAATRRTARRSGPAQGRVPGHAGPRAAQPAGADPQRRCRSCSSSAAGRATVRAGPRR